MFGLIVLVLLFMGFDFNLVILMLGVGILLFFLLVGGCVLSYLGLSFFFIGLVIVVIGYVGFGFNVNFGVVLGGIIVCGVVYVVIGLIVFGVGMCWIEFLMLLVVIGVVVVVIGLNLVLIVVKGVFGSSFDSWMVLVIIFCVGFVVVFMCGML